MRQSVTDESLSWTRITVPAATSLPGSSDCMIARTVAELRFVAPEIDMISPAFVIFWFATAALSPITFGTMHGASDFSSPH